MCLSLGYPSADFERALLRGADRRRLIDAEPAVLNPADILSLQTQVRAVTVSEALLDYLQALVERTRDGKHALTGLSPRAALALLRAAQSWALLEGRQAVLPEDVQAVFVAVAAHRLTLDATHAQTQTVAETILKSVPIP